MRAVLAAALLVVASCHLADDLDPPKCPDGYHVHLERCVENAAAETMAKIGEGCTLTPNPLTVKSGREFAWKNEDKIAHVVTSLDGKLSESMSAGTSSRAIVVSTPGSYPYHVSDCPAGAGTGTLVVE